MCDERSKIGISNLNPSASTAANLELAVFWKFDLFESGDSGENLPRGLEYPISSQMVQQVPAAVAGVMIRNPTGQRRIELYLSLPDELADKD